LIQLGDDDDEFCEPLIDLLLVLGYKPKSIKKALLPLNLKNTGELSSSLKLDIWGK